MQDEKQKRKTKLMLIGSVIVIFLFIVIRVITTNSGYNGGLGAYNGPEFDSVELPPAQNKISQFDEEKRIEDAKKYHPDESKDAVFMDFKKAYTKTDGTFETEKKNNESDPTLKRKNESPSENNRYSPVSYKKKSNENPEEREQKISKNKTNVETQEEPVQVAEQENNPFGTIKSEKSKTVTGHKKVKDMVRAEVYGNQKIPNGGGIIFRNTEDIFIGDLKIPKNSILHGKATYRGNDRVMINVTRAKTQQGDEIVDLTCFDNDYIEGIFFKAPVDEAVDKTKDDAGDDIGDQIKNSRLIVKGVKTVEKVVKNTADAVKKDRKLSVDDGYIVYLKINIKKK